jgi:hypothetical protein
MKSAGEWTFCGSGWNQLQEEPGAFDDAVPPELAELFVAWQPALSVATANQVNIRAPQRRKHPADTFTTRLPF